MQAVHVGIGGDDDAVEFQAADIEHITGTCAKHVDDGAYLFILNDTLQIGFRHVERFAFQLQDSLEI